MLYLVYEDERSPASRDEEEAFRFIIDALVFNL